MIRLVVNAEEFGAVPATDARILEAHRVGIVSSTSVVGNCGDVLAAGAVLAEAPELGVGLCLTLMGGEPVAPPADVASLLTPARTLPDRARDFAVAWWTRAIAPEHVERELEAQIARALDAGLAVDHLCTRGHLGLLPGVGQIVERLARRHRVAGIRTSGEPPTLGWITDPRRGLEAGVVAGLAWLTRRRLGALRHGPRTWGYLESGRLDEVRIMEIIGRLDPGAHELICHPGGDGRGTHGSPASDDVGGLTELRALTSTKVKTALARRGIVVCRWRDLF